MAETIEVVFEKLSDAPQYYHETLIYTDATGAKHLATAYATTIPPGSLGALSEAASTATAGKPSPYGVMVTETAKVSDLPQASQDHWLGTAESPYPSIVVSKGADLGTQWRAIQDTYKEIGDQKFAYSPLTQNSNSAASTALHAAGIPLPKGTTILGNLWAPASHFLLPVSSNPGLLAKLSGAVLTYARASQTSVALFLQTVGAKFSTSKAGPVSACGKK